MPAPKRKSSSKYSQPKIRKLDEDKEAPSSKTAPASNKKSHKAGKALKKTVAPRTKKVSPPAEDENKPAKSSHSFSNQMPPAKESSKTTSDPPAKKAKLQKATSASSCGAASPSNSKASLKRRARLLQSASTESEDDISSDGSKADFFRVRDDGDKARCIRQYSNRVKAKREAVESDLHEKSQVVSPEPTDLIQMDHNYGICSGSSSVKIPVDTYPSEKKESANSDLESERKENSDIATYAHTKDILVFETEYTKASVKSECEAEESEDTELKKLKSQKLSDDTLLRETLDCATGQYEKSGTTSEDGGKQKDIFNSITDLKSQPHVDNEKVAHSVCSVPNILSQSVKVKIRQM
ncbi:serine/arginine repetitive matrix protein 1-like [Thalassophryne amazonica]|uniref:serine/arginine repetitive matrix protein 1-like n=1 Tax=Thalassophryne amazonica TaxID=390379 RepID=UPI001470CF2A|nr:serine/arginine repetitive matrix protein 1-like [Thalassophryne amazonica]